MNFRLLLVVLLATLPLMAVSQTSYPKAQSLFVNDFADVLGPEAEARIEPILTGLRENQDIEATLVTILSKRDYMPGLDLEAFATGLFNSWGIGDTTRNDGILLLYVHDDREVRIELGAGYGQDWNNGAAIVVDDFLVPNFKAGRVEVGLEKGVVAIRDELAIPFRNGGAPPVRNSRSSRFSPLFVFVLFGVILLFGAGRLAGRFRRCPQCGARGSLATRRDPSMPVTGSGVETGTQYTSCSNCTYQNTRPYRRTRSRRHRSEGGGFGGGRSGGGGASGRW